MVATQQNPAEHANIERTHRLLELAMGQNRRHDRVEARLQTRQWTADRVEVGGKGFQFARRRVARLHGL